MTGRFDFHADSGPHGHGPIDTLVAICRTARQVTNAAAVSISVIDDDGLRYVAADGAGADEIVGTVLTGGRGLASYVAASGQAMSVGRPESDPRFARDIAERTGYVPQVMLLVPVAGTDGDPAGVLTILDPHRDDPQPDEPDTLSVAAAFAEIASGPLVQVGRIDAADETADLVDRLNVLAPERRTRLARAMTAMIDALDT